MNPKVSVLIIAHDDSYRLKRSIRSVIAQTYKNIEIAVMYVGSADDRAAKKIVKTYGGRIKYYRNGNGSVSDALNAGVKQLTGEYFSWLSQEDTYHPRIVEKLVSLASNDKNIIAVSGWAQVSHRNKRLRTHEINPIIEKHPSYFLADAKGVDLNTCAMLFPLAMLKKESPFDEYIPSSHDYKLLNHLIKAGAEFKVSNEILLNYAAQSDDMYLIDSTSETNCDFSRSDLIRTLSPEAVLSYFGSIENAIENYRKTLGLGRPRSAAFLIEKIVRSVRDINDQAAMIKILTDELSGAHWSSAATEADNLLSKISQPSRKKKLLFSSAHWLTGGMERVMASLFVELENNYEIFLITPYHDSKSKIDIPNFVTHIKLSEEYFQKHFDAAILSYALLLNIDVVIGFINLFNKQLNLYQLCAGTEIKTIASNHEYYFYPYKSPYHYDVVEKRVGAYSDCDAVVWPNNFNAALCGINTDNSYVIGNPNNFKAVQTEGSVKNNVIISVGRFHDYVKRVDRILECFSLVLEKTPDAQLILVGKYDKDESIIPGGRLTINNIMEEFAIPSDRVSFAGEVNNVEDYYAKAKVLLLTSNSEGFGMTINEAACFGVPAVGNYIPGIEDIIKDGQSGYITEQGDLVSMASKVSDILTDDGLLEKLGKNARERAKLYDSQQIGDKWKFLISSLLGIKNKGELRTKLNSELGYSMPDQRLFSKILAKEINEIFYLSLEEGSRRKITNDTLLLLAKVAGFPRRLKANVRYVGLPRTINKVATRSYRLARTKLKI